MEQAGQRRRSRETKTHLSDIPEGETAACDDTSRPSSIETIRTPPTHARPKHSSRSSFSSLRRSKALLRTGGNCGFVPPRFVVDLSVGPEHRYHHIVDQVLPAGSRAGLEGIFQDLCGRGLVAAGIQGLSKRMLTRVYTDEETAELRGIARQAAIPMYLLVAFNVLLDLLMGCTSGGVRFEDSDGPGSFDATSSGDDCWTGSEHDAPPPLPPLKRTSRIVHFRTLDWGMDLLRHLIVELDYVREAGGPVIATTVGYLGYVGVLTGVRPGLSMSLNFRPHHDKSTKAKRLGFRWQQLMVILGRRPSISSLLRHYLLCRPGETLRRGASRPTSSHGAGVSDQDQAPLSAQHVRDMLTELSASPSTAAYLIFCTAQRVYVLEKDHGTAAVRSDAAFLTACNHDAADEAHPRWLQQAVRHLEETGAASCIAELCLDSLGRKRAAQSLLAGIWLRRQARLQRLCAGVGLEDVMRLVGDRSISNPQTHYAVVMDPESGGLLWRRAYEVGDL
ncbi:hypothetical protein P8C59_009039 [Phyllachora maydis]|uniref:ceramidase n=1 Tax=Phyllachora maydis TaxID=1825666 RepID=A0AAD9MFT2_9PEZI|nr:hypothetical protein P8C59_009039 [Phyllachora maydis]